MATTKHVTWTNPGLAASRAMLGLPVTLGAAGFAAAAPYPVVWVFAGPVALAGLLLLYVAVGRLVNRSRIHLDDDGIRVVHGPLPWLPGPTLRRGEILGFAVTFDADAGFGEAPETLSAAVRHRRAQRGRVSVEAALAAAVWRSLAPSWSVEVAVVGGAMFPLVDGLRERGSAQQLHDELKAWLEGPA